VNDDDISHLPLDEQFIFLLHKKIMHKPPNTKRQAKWYYTHQYQKTGLIPKPLLMAGQGLLDGRKCSGRTRVISDEIAKRFKEMVIASCDEKDLHFIFISQKARKINSFHKWLEEEFNESISLDALYHLSKRENLKQYLEKSDFEPDETNTTYFNSVSVFELIQIDGCTCQLFKIKDLQDKWKKPLVIEFFDTGSRNLLTLDFYFSESNENAIRQFAQFLLSSPFPQKNIRLRPDNAKAFLNLKRPIRELNQMYSDSEHGFFLQPDFAAVQAPKHKVHLESSHRTLHNFEAHIIKHFSHKIVAIKPGYLFTGRKKVKIKVTYIDINIDELRDSDMLKAYLKSHNETNHKFSHQGTTQAWIPQQKLQHYIEKENTFKFESEAVEKIMPYGFKKTKAKVLKDRTITYNNCHYCVTEGKSQFSTHRSTAVKISLYQNKLFIFEDKADGLLIAKAIKKGPSHTPKSVQQKTQMHHQAHQFDIIKNFLQSKQMIVTDPPLEKQMAKGLTLQIAQQIYDKYHQRYDKYVKKINHPDEVCKGALFNAFIMDCERHCNNEPKIFSQNSHKGDE
jgi:hypothetical protein